MAEPITSPTFTLASQYEGRLELNHLDVYRLEQLAEVLDLGLPEMLDEGGVTLVEWGDAIIPALPADYLLVRLTYGDDDDDRTLEIEPVGGRWSARTRALTLALGPWLADGPVLILGIDTATAQVSCAIGGHEGVLASTLSSRGKRHAESLTPAIEFTCRQARIELSEISVVAVDLGPGLFTGLRVGVATAKAMAHALRVPMIGVPSLDLLAFPVRFTSRLIVAAVDARRGELFYAFYRQVPGGRAAARRAPGGHARRPGRRAAGRRARSACSSATVPSATARSSTASTRSRSSARSWPTRRRRRW